MKAIAFMPPAVISQFSSLTLKLSCASQHAKMDLNKKAKDYLKRLEIKIPTKL